MLKRPVAAEELERLRHLFWDKRLESSDLDEYPRWVISRVLDHGDLEDVRTLIELFGRETFLYHVARARFSFEKTENFWRGILQMENIPWEKKPFRPEVNLFWESLKKPLKPS